MLLHQLRTGQGNAAGTCFVRGLAVDLRGRSLQTMLLHEGVGKTFKERKAIC